LFRTKKFPAFITKKNRIERNCHFYHSLRFLLYFEAVLLITR